MTSSAAGGDLVGHRDLGHLQLTSQRVGCAPQVDHRGDAGAADGHVGDAPSPGPPEGIGDQHARLRTGSGSDAVADAARRTVGIGRQQRREPLLDVAEIDARVGAHETVARLRYHQVAPAAQHPHRLGLHHRLVACRIARIDRGETVLGLRHHFLGDHHTVVVTQPVLSGRLDDHHRQVVTRAHLADPDDRQHLQAHGVTVLAAVQARLRAAGRDHRRLMGSPCSQRCRLGSAAAGRDQRRLMGSPCSQRCRLGSAAAGRDQRRLMGPPRRPCAGQAPRRRRHRT